MSTPISKTIVDRVELILESITEIKQVLMFPRIPTDRAKVIFPFSAVHIAPDEYEKRNMLEANSMAVTIATMFECKVDRENIQAKAYEYDAAIHYAIFNDETLANLCERRIREIPEFEYQSETEGAVVSKYYLTYLHKYGDPYTRNI